MASVTPSLIKVSTSRGQNFPLVTEERKREDLAGILMRWRQRELLRGTAPLNREEIKTSLFLATFLKKCSRQSSQEWDKDVSNLSFLKTVQFSLSEYEKKKI